MNKLTEAQVEILRELSKGRCIAYSRDGDYGWLSGSNEFLADKDIWALRNLQYIEQEHDEREDDYGCDKISPAGRLAISGKADSEKM